MPGEDGANDGAPDDFDRVTDEVARWAGMGVEEYEKFTTEDGLLNEFAMMWALRNKFPLHYVIFQQTACHLPHEANVEQIFSRAWAAGRPQPQPGPPRCAGQDWLQQEGLRAGSGSDQREVLRAVPRQRGLAQGGLLGRGRCGIFIGGRGGRGGFVVGCRRRGIVNI